MVLHVSCRADNTEKHILDVNKLLFHQGKLYSAGDKGVIKIWTPDLTLLGEIQAHSSSIYCLTANEDTLFSCSDEGYIKSWDLETFKEKVVFKDANIEFWNVLYTNGVLYSGDDQGNIKIFKDGKYHGSINVAEGVKDMLIEKNLVFTSKNNDIVVTDLNLDGDRLLYYLKTTLFGRGPLAIIGDKLLYVTRDGRGLILNRIDKEQKINDVITRSGAHEMIINTMQAVNWDNHPRNSSLFTGGWDRVVKRWQVTNESITQAESCQAHIVINSIVQGEPGTIYAGGSDGHIIRLDV